MVIACPGASTNSYKFLQNSNITTSGPLLQSIPCQDTTPCDDEVKVDASAHALIQFRRYKAYRNSYETTLMGSIAGRHRRLILAPSPRVPSFL